MQNFGIMQALEQLGAFARDFAPAVRSYYEGLVNAGFTEGQAMDLTAEWQTVVMVEMVLPKRDGGES